ncbi:MAG: protein-tyrosine phosphatase family protein [bacterium]
MFNKTRFFILTAACLLSFLFSTDYLNAKVQKHTLIGPRSNIATDTPAAYGFWSFAIVEQTKISRSGQPTIGEFNWLKNNNWQSIVDLRTDGEYKEIGDNQKIKGFKDLKFTYLYLPIKDGGVPTKKQANIFLDFVKNPKNQPAHVHCRGGYGRTGTMIALYRFMIDNWPMVEAIAESRLYHGGISSKQQKWLLAWEKDHGKK